MLLGKQQQQTKQATTTRKGAAATIKATIKATTARQEYIHISKRLDAIRFEPKVLYDLRGTCSKISFFVFLFFFCFFCIVKINSFGLVPLYV